MLKVSGVADMKAILHLSFYYFPSVDYKPVQVETTDGTPITDWSIKPPSTVYVVGKKIDL